MRKQLNLWDVGYICNFLRRNLTCRGKDQREIMMQQLNKVKLFSLRVILVATEIFILGHFSYSIAIYILAIKEVL
jgi:hypothetical protein